MKKTKTPGQLLREWRLSKEWSRNDLAQGLGVSRAYVGMLETNAHASPSLHLAQLLHSLSKGAVAIDRWDRG